MMMHMRVSTLSTFSRVAVAVALYSFTRHSEGLPAAMRRHDYCSY
jgi:hypothetical protein